MELQLKGETTIDREVSRQEYHTAISKYGEIKKREGLKKLKEAETQIRIAKRQVKSKRVKDKKGLLKKLKTLKKLAKVGNIDIEKPSYKAIQKLLKDQVKKKRVNIMARVKDKIPSTFISGRERLKQSHIGGKR